MNRLRSRMILLLLFRFSGITGGIDCLMVFFESGITGGKSVMKNSATEIKRLAAAVAVVSPMDPYVTAAGGIVVLSGPFPVARAEAIAGFYRSATETLMACSAEIDRREAIEAELLQACRANEQCIADFLELYKRGCSSFILDEAAKSLRDDALKLTKAAIARATAETPGDEATKCPPVVTPAKLAPTQSGFTFGN